MNQKLVFKIYYGIYLHFNSAMYSMLTYGIDTKATLSKFDKLSTEQLYRFDWLARKYTDTQDIVYAMIGCQFDGVNVCYGPKEAIVDAYYKFKTRRDTMSYVLEREHIKDELTGHLPIDKLILKYMVGEFSPEYIILKTHNNDDLTDLYNNINFSWAKPKILKLIKYKPFFNFSKYIHLTELNENHV